MENAVGPSSNLLDTIRFDERGLVPAVAQDRLTGRIQMVAWMDREAVAVTLSTKLATFYSRSRGRLWTKGESSGHHLHVSAVFVDCDGDTLLLQVEPVGPSCHTGTSTCFFRRAGDSGLEPAEPAEPYLQELEQVIAQRKASTAERSYTKTLLDKGPVKIGEKLREEADELAQALEAESTERVISEAGDVLYHLLVGLRLRDVEFRQVVGELARRAGVSGHQEKASRKS